MGRVDGQGGEVAGSYVFSGIAAGTYTAQSRGDYSRCIRGGGRVLLGEQFPGCNVVLLLVIGLRSRILLTQYRYYRIMRHVYSTCDMVNKAIGLQICYRHNG